MRGLRQQFRAYRATLRDDQRLWPAADQFATTGLPVIRFLNWNVDAMTVICLLPEYLVSALSIPFYLGGTSLLIVVNVTMDTVTQIQSHLLAHQYGDLIKKAKLKGARRR